MAARKSPGSSSEGHEMLKTKKQASSSSVGSEILKTNKEALAAISLLCFIRVPGRSEKWMDHWREMKATAAAEEAARPAKKRKRVVKKRIPKAAIDLLVARPHRTVEDLTPDQLAKHSTEFRQFYSLTTFVDGKFRDYEQALIRQYNAQGYAEIEIEESEEEDAAAVEDQ